MFEIDGVTVRVARWATRKEQTVKGYEWTDKQPEFEKRIESDLRKAVLALYNEKWRVAYIGNDAKSYQHILTAFQAAYENNNRPNNMTLYSHNDSFGHLMALSITPASVPYCAFSTQWYETDQSPLRFGLIAWIHGDKPLK